MHLLVAGGDGRADRVQVGAEGCAAVQRKSGRGGRRRLLLLRADPRRRHRRGRPAVRPGRGPHRQPGGGGGAAEQVGGVRLQLLSCCH